MCTGGQIWHFCGVHGTRGLSPCKGDLDQDLCIPDLFALMNPNESLKQTYEHSWDLKLLSTHQIAGRHSFQAIQLQR